MKKVLLFFSLIILVFLSCNKAPDANHPYTGVFVTQTGTTFELRADSTAIISFSDSLSYEASWMPMVSSDSLQYANIEFAGFARYYYLKDGKLYRSELNMRNDFCGEPVTYKD